MTIGDLLKKQAMSRKGVAAYNPTPKQCEAGNYPKLHLKIQGMNIAVENPKGSYRRGVSPDGSKWETLMKFDYAYVKGSKGVDGDEVDIFLGPKARWSPVVHVIDQVYNGKFDEHKCMLGWDTQAEAKKAYLSCYEKGWNGCGDITTMSIRAFKKWCKAPKGAVSPVVKEALQKAPTRESAKEHLSILIKAATDPSRGTLIKNSPQAMYGNQSLADSLSKYYQHLRGGLDEAVLNSQKSWGETNPKRRMINRDDMPGMLREVPVLKSTAANSKKNRIAHYNYATDKVYLDPKGDHKQGSKEHELTHALHLRPRYESNKKLNYADKLIQKARIRRDFNKDFKKIEIGDKFPYSDKATAYLSQKGEIAVRLAEARRRYAYTHPGEDVTSPEQADKALKWFTTANPADYEKGLIEKDTQTQLRLLNKFIEDKEFMRRLMPTTTQNNRNSRTRRAYVT